MIKRKLRRLIGRILCALWRHDVDEWAADVPLGPCSPILRLDLKYCSRCSKNLKK